MSRLKPTAYFCVDTPFGEVVGLVAGDTLLSMDYAEETPPPENLPALSEKEQQRYGDAICAVIDGRDPEFWPKMQPYGTEFQQRVWWGLQQIPKGHTWSYGELAEFIGSPKGASRAVGSACGKNPIALFIPCHRIIRQNGDIGGFGWGLPLKEHLLRKEGVQLDMFDTD